MTLNSFAVSMVISLEHFHCGNTVTHKTFFSYMLGVMSSGTRS